MCSEPLPKKFVKTTEILPIVTYGISTVADIRKAEAEISFLEKLKKAGLTADEVKLYRDNETGVLDHHIKIESSVLKQKLGAIYEKINEYEKTEQSFQDVQQPSSSAKSPDDIFAKLKDKPITIYPDPHPMNNLKEIEENLFGHLYDEIVTSSNTKRKKALRRFERMKERVLAQKGRVQVPTTTTQTVNREGSLWDVKELPKKQNTEHNETAIQQKPAIIGPEPKPVMYTIRNNKIVRLETLPGDRGIQVEEFQAIDIVVPNNNEEQLLEGTKMSVDDIRKMERFQNYEPGRPSKVLFLKNIAPSVTSDQLSLLFNQFVLANGGPVDVRLLTGRMKGQAFVHMQNEDVAIQALEETNGTILNGRPIIAQFGRE